MFYELIICLPSCTCSWILLSLFDSEPEEYIPNDKDKDKDKQFIKMK